MADGRDGLTACRRCVGARKAHHPNTRPTFTPSLTCHQGIASSTKGHRGHATHTSVAIPAQHSFLPAALDVIAPRRAARLPGDIS